MKSAARGYEQHEAPAFTAALDARRLETRRRYRAQTAPVQRPVWETLEKDQPGRSILRAGDWYRVLDDPTAAND